MRHFPIFMNLRDQSVIVIGGGEVAIAKLRLLLKTEAKITVFAPRIDPVIEEWLIAGRLKWRAHNPSANDYTQAKLVYVALDDNSNAQPFIDAAHQAGALVNVVDDLENSDFITPAIVDRDPVTVAIGTEGAAPVMARKIKAHLEDYLPSDLGGFVSLGASLRDRIAHQSAVWRRAFWRWYYDEANIRDWRRDGSNFHDKITAEFDARETANDADKLGFVSFVGAGPGDPDLLTMRARRVLDDADVVIYDRLVDARILELARREALLIDVGKTPYQPTRTQDEINAIIIEHVRAGAKIVRLKSGDPVIYGRLDEEIAAISPYNIEFDVVPGVSAANAAAASMGASLTRRGRNATLRYITGHDANGFADYEWRDLARDDQALAIYMGRRAATFFSGRLLMHGANPATPITAIANVSRPDETRVNATLATLPQTLDALPNGAPVVILYGVASVTDEIDVNQIPINAERHTTQVKKSLAL